MLLVGVLVLLAAVSTLAGSLATRNRMPAAAGVVGAVVVVGALAPLGRGGSGPSAVFATLLGGILSILVLWRLGTTASAGWPSAPRDDRGPTISPGPGAAFSR
ncbi:MAG: hypothetical protein R2716_13285 [Microthrixaceae bacterium]